MDVLYVIIALAAVAIAFYLWSRKASPPPSQLEEKKALPLKGHDEPERREASKKHASPAEKVADVARPKASDKASDAPSALAPTGKPEAVPPSPSSEPARAESEPLPLPVQSAVAPHQDETPPASEPHRPLPSIPHISDVAGMRQGLAKSRSSEGIFGRLAALFTGKKEISPEITEEVEQVLLSSDVGVKTTEDLLGRIKERLSKGELKDADSVWDALRSEALAVLATDGTAGAFPLRGRPTVVLLVGVNGAGKTTTIGKLATRLKAEGRSVILAAADTFRAAAVQQLVVWGKRVGVEVVSGKDGADPGSVAFDAIQKAMADRVDVVLVDTAGRLHTKANLMAELGKVVRTTTKALADAPHEVLLVIDSTNGQNALSQAREFKEALPLTGVVLTKLDGTAKGGVVLGICDTLRLPVRFIGLGEKPNDLYDFVPEDFVEALLGRE